MREIQDHQLSQSRQLLPSRRALLAGAGVTCAAMLAGCTANDASNGGVTPATGGTATSAGSSAPAVAANALAATSQIPDGGGKIIDGGKNIVITQPEPGSFKAFSAICTHEGCIVASVSDGTINCPCHGSKFSIENGSVVHGPAPSPLAAVAIKVEGTSIFQG
jgi:Rieske Fe-S protein